MHDKNLINRAVPSEKYSWSKRELESSWVILAAYLEKDMSFPNYPRVGISSFRNMVMLIATDVLSFNN